MENSTHESLIESSENEDDFCSFNDNYDDGSHFLYVINSILSGTARLNVLLPTATILAFTIFAPLLTNDGVCTALNRWLMGIFVVLSASSCVFFTFTDSFKTVTGRLYYGMATFQGIWTFNAGRKKPCVPSNYRLKWADLFHASLSLIAFLDRISRISRICRVSRKVTNTLPLVVGFLISVLFVMFPSKRRGIGYPFLLHKDALYSRR
ncbi:hypothetical protein UlMin_036227 [Ulmus minor]